MRVRGCVVIGATASIVAAGACLVGLRVCSNRPVGNGSAGGDDALTWNDRYTILDAKNGGDHSYVLVHVWTTVPDLMQRVDLYCYEGVRTTAERADFLLSRQVVSENLDENWQRPENGGYAARVPTKGTIDLRRRSITVEFDKGPPQLIAVPSLVERGRCPTRG